MDQVLTELIASFGVVSGSFIWLLVWTMKKNETREDKYQKVIEIQAMALNSFSKEVGEIKKILEREGLK